MNRSSKLIHWLACWAGPVQSYPRQSSQHPVFEGTNTSIKVKPLVSFTMTSRTSLIRVRSYSEQPGLELSLFLWQVCTEERVFFFTDFIEGVRIECVISPPMLAAVKNVHGSFSHCRVLSFLLQTTSARSRLCANIVTCDDVQSSSNCEISQVLSA